ncbi:hypothetical protein Lal_00000869 [Lupinus albus]|uniref:Putative DnaJ domain-containing protein n=1 Tax=Lupinus albus TaxID=3870 RepID=A0A6A5LIH6_LUPAL|nr:putative DnaJ domain-containing protein [Lupinus albus]KAF1859045.1 hypothetical protein Lal_00000869 [Lupinus albus]
MKDQTNDTEKDDKPQDIKLWAIFLFGLIGATASRFALSRSRGSSFRSAFQEEAWKRYNKRLQEEYEEEMERVERIRRMQNVFNRERNKHKRNYESWTENGTGAYHQHSQRDDWYWKAEETFRDQWSNYRNTPRDNGNYSLSHHYSVLGLDRSRTTPYTDAEIKIAFRNKAKQHHPDQNQDNKEAAETKFKEVMCSYEAIQQERKNQNL